MVAGGLPMGQTAAILFTACSFKCPMLLLDLAEIPPGCGPLQPLPHERGLGVQQADTLGAGARVCVHVLTLPPASGRSTESGGPPEGGV